MMRIITLSFSVLAICFMSYQADAFEMFEELQPVNRLFDDVAGFGDSCGSSCGETSCTSCNCDCPPAPTMIGGSSLGNPHTLSTPFHNLQFSNFYSRVSENNSAIPQDRVFFTYKFLNDVPTLRDDFADAADQDVDMSHYEFGLEKTLFDGNVSVELLIPFAYVPGSSFAQAAGLPDSETELQNIAFGFKGLLAETENSALTAGLRVDAPTRENIQNLDTGFVIPRDVWTVTPYLATLINLNDDLFFQAFASYRLQTDDFAYVSTPFLDREPNYFDLDAQLGYWLYRNMGGTGLTGLQAKAEIHYTGTFEPWDFPVNSFPSQFGETDQLNLTTGLTAIVNDKTTITLGVVLPVRDGSGVSFQPGMAATRPQPSDRYFDWQANLQVNYYFGNQ